MLTVSLSSCGLDDRTRQPFGHLLSKLFSNTFLTASTRYLSFTFFTSRPNYIQSQQQHWLAPPFPLHLSRFFPYPYPCSPTPFSSSHLVLVTPLAQSFFFFSVILDDPIPRVISHSCHWFLSGQSCDMWHEQFSLLLFHIQTYGSHSNSPYDSFFLPLCKSGPTHWFLFLISPPR